MKTIHAMMPNRWWLAVMWLMSVTFSTQAQTTTPPVLQWQQVIEGGVDFSSTIYAAKSATGEFGTLTGTTLTRLTASGAVKWSGPVEGSVVTSTNPLTYSTALRTSGLLPTPDGGFLVQANDAANLYLIKKDANGNRVWSKIIIPSVEGSASESYRGLDLIQTPDGGYLSFATHFLQGYTSRTFVNRFDQDGNLVSSREPNPTVFSPPSNQGPAGKIFFRRLALPDGGYIQVGADEIISRRPWPTLPYAERFNAQGNIVWSRLYSSAVFYDIIPNPDGSGSFIIATTAGPVGMLPNGDLIPGALGNPPNGPAGDRRAFIASDGTGQPFYVTLNEGTGRLVNSSTDFLLRGYNQQNQEVWSRILGGSSIDSPQVLLTTGDGYLLVGKTNSTDGDVQGKQGNALATWVVKLAKTATLFSLTQPTYNCQSGAIVFNTSGGDGSSITYNAPGISRSSPTSNSGTVETGLRNDPKPITITATQNGQTVSYTYDFGAFCSGTQPPVNPPTPPTPPTGGSLVLTQPTYNCQSGAIVFNTSGGDGSSITYNAPGISRSSLTSNSGTVETGLRNDPKPITITATQGGQTVSFTFDLAAFCSGTQPPVNPPTPPTGGTLTLLAPTYDCATGAITFRSSGGNGTIIEYAAAGITGWTTNPNQFVDRDSRTANDVQPFTLMARQNGVTVSYVWDLKAACGRARVGVAEPEAGLSVIVLGNPVDGKAVEVDIRGVSGQAVQVDLLDLQGRVLHQQRIDQAGSSERVSIPTGNATPLLLLNVSTATQRKQVKLLKP